MLDKHHLRFGLKGRLSLQQINVNFYPETLKKALLYEQLF